MANRWVNLSDADINMLAAFCESSGYLSLSGKLHGVQKTITKASGKSKGRNLQKWVAGKIADILGIPYNQQDDQCLIHAREMGQAGVDIILRGEAQTRFPFAVECKSSEGMSVQAFVAQAMKSAKPGIDWLVAYKCKMYAEPVVIMSWDAFERLFTKERIWTNRKK